MRDIDGALFKQQYDRGAAEAEKPLLLAAADDSGLVMVADPPDKAGADLDLRDDSEVFCVENGVFACVLDEHGLLAHNDGLHRMVAPGDVIIAAFEAVVDVAVAVVILYAEPQHEADAAQVLSRDLAAADKVFNIIVAVLN